jgi:hypothetical protein
MTAIKNILLLVFLSLTFLCKATETKPPHKYYFPAVIENGDTIACIPLKEVIVIAPYAFKDKKLEKFYWQTVRDVKKTLPYAKMASKVVEETNEHLKTLSTEKEKKEYIKATEKVLFSQFENDLKSLSISQGKILIRLIDRQCDETSYDLIRTYKGGFSAFLWQGVARFFGSNLKSEYDGSDKDKVIERVIVLVEEGRL